jgi:RNA polymerase sigma factor (sigma-70 family)
MNHESSGNSGQQASPSSGQWTDIVQRIQAGDESGMADLYTVFSKGIRFFLCRQLGPQELDDKVHDTFVIVVQAIQRGDLREPERLMGFVRTIVRRQIAAYIDQAVQARRDQAEIGIGVTIADRGADPEHEAMDQQRTELMTTVLNELSGRDREILTRFYLLEQNQLQICEDMQLTETQFRLLKSRAKARFGELGRKKLQARGSGGFFLRGSNAPQHLLG